MATRSLYPLTVTPKVPGQPIHLRAHLRYLVCEQICIPYEHDLALNLPRRRAGGERGCSPHQPLPGNGAG